MFRSFRPKAIKRYVIKYVINDTESDSDVFVVWDRKIRRKVSITRGDFLINECLFEYINKRG